MDWDLLRDRLARYDVELFTLGGVTLTLSTVAKLGVLLVAVWWSAKYMRETSARYFIPEIGTHLDRSLGLYQERGAIVPGANGTFKVDFAKMRQGVKDLATEMLTIEATGDFARAQRLLDKYGVSNAEIDGVIKGLPANIPVDITPVFPGAGEK